MSGWQAAPCRRQAAPSTRRLRRATARSGARPARAATARRAGREYRVSSTPLNASAQTDARTSSHAFRPSMSSKWRIIGGIPTGYLYSPGADVGQSRRRCGHLSHGADVGHSRPRFGHSSHGADVGQSRRRCGPGQPQRGIADTDRAPLRRRRLACAAAHALRCAQMALHAVLRSSPGRIEHARVREPLPSQPCATTGVRRCASGRGGARCDGCGRRTLQRCVRSQQPVHVACLYGNGSADGKRYLQPFPSCVRCFKGFGSLMCSLF
jgi:hypothetical protein